MRAMWVTFEDGPWDGRAYASYDDQVPAVVCSSQWDRYEISHKVYNDGLLVAATYTHTGKA